MLRFLIAFAYGWFIAYIGYPFYTWQFWVLVILFNLYVMTWAL